jgi:hypothetical protein
MGPMLLAGAYVVEKDSSAKWKYYEPVLFETQHAKGYVSSTIRENLRKMSENVNFIDGRDGYVAIFKSESLETKQLTLAKD